MSSFAITCDTTAIQISKSLKTFGRFSKAELIYRPFYGHHIYELREVKLTERLRKFFTEGREVRLVQRKAAREFLDELSKSHSEIADALGKKVDSLRPSLRAGSATVPTSGPASIFKSKEKKAPQEPGVHFVTNSPFSLKANRIIVPRDAAVEAKVNFSSGRVFGLANNNKLNQTIAIDDRDKPYDQYSADDLRDIYKNLLSQSTESVVITPVIYEKDKLKAIIEAATTACKDNTSLSVTFAVDNADHQQKISAAYADVLSTSDAGSVEYAGHKLNSLSFIQQAEWKSI